MPELVKVLPSKFPQVFQDGEKTANRSPSDWVFIMEQNRVQHTDIMSANQQCWFIKPKIPFKPIICLSPNKQTNKLPEMLVLQSLLLSKRGLSFLFFFFYISAYLCWHTPSVRIQQCKCTFFYSSYKWHGNVGLSVGPTLWS